MDKTKICVKLLGEIVIKQKFKVTQWLEIKDG